MLALLILLIAPFPAEAQAADLPAKIHEYVAAYAALGDFSGCISVQRPGTVNFQRCYGKADYELNVPNTPETKFRIGSLSKQFTAAAILVLEQRGRLSVDDPVAKHLPGFPNGERITLHHLMTHSSGLRDIFGAPGYEAIKRNGATPVQLVALFKDLPLEFEPGASFAYSNSGYILLAHLIETISDQPYGEFLQQAVLAPAGMTQSGHELQPPIIAGRAAGYDPAGLSGIENAPYVDPSVTIGAGSIYSTVSDLRRWVQTLVSDRLLTAESRAKMFKRQASYYGYGVAVYREHDRRVIAHDGRIAGFSADLSWYPDEGLSVIVLSNIQSGIGDSFRRDLAAIVYGAEYELPEPRIAAETPPTPAELTDYVGRYQFGPNFIVVARRSRGRLFVAANSSEFSELTPLKGGAFINRVTYSRVRFERDDEGAVRAMIWMQDGNEFRGERLPD